jgi:hypothetical protein
MKNIFNRKTAFILLMIISTSFVACSAAYYSVFGLSYLFAGAKFEVIIMASSLEISKLVVASYLHNNWKIAGWMKYYLTSAVFILMIITSLGIYGFLTSAYQKTADKLVIVDKKVNVIQLKKGRFQEQFNGYRIEKEQLNQSISELSKGLSNNVIQYKDKETGQIITTTSSSTRRVLKSQLNDFKEQRNLTSLKIEALTDSITTLDLKILDLESNNEIAAEVGPLRYLAKITGKSMDIIVNWFTLLIVFVFDPLAIAMVIALNKLLRMGDTPPKRRIEKVIKEEPIVEDEQDTEDEIVSTEEVKEEEPPKPTKNLYGDVVRKKYTDSDNTNMGR